MALASTPKGATTEHRPTTIAHKSHDPPLLPHYPFGIAMWGHRLRSNDLTTSQNCHMPAPITGQTGTSPGLRCDGEKLETNLVLGMDRH